MLWIILAVLFLGLVIFKTMGKTSLVVFVAGILMVGAEFYFFSTNFLICVAMMFSFLIGMYILYLVLKQERRKLHERMKALGMF